ncbi:hypothetical protein CAPTEDRAFT_208916 [Capitella teleta]|uniref:C-type lectin domain-containing protein n=1 Tax=Capitella teleta TaxID=283909 RepID=R7TBP4_CAPTE|nr:hypothetical protein CAPTEDRAFT_208916 [Capitella teleta]|eukprot:ELT88907.1 hypothetical protein CAPTEDRAFT_208916 [Capitella teleta]
MRGIDAFTLGVILGPLSYLAPAQEAEMQEWDCEPINTPDNDITTFYQWIRLQHTIIIPFYEWHEYNNKMYLFVMDAARQMDQSRDEASTECQSRHGNLVSIETEDEMAFIKRRIKVQESIIGQESLNDQWWTSGVASNGEWIWDNAEMDIITISALKRKTVPVRKSHHFLALQHSTEGWRLRTMPDNYKLRYICERQGTLLDIPLLPNPWHFTSDGAPSATLGHGSGTSHAAAIMTAEALRTTEERLLDRLLRQYDPDARGVAKSSDPMNVKIQFYLVRIHDLSAININGCHNDSHKCPGFHLPSEKYPNSLKSERSAYRELNELLDLHNFRIYENIPLIMAMRSLLAVCEGQTDWDYNYRQISKDQDVELIRIPSP